MPSKQAPKEKGPAKNVVGTDTDRDRSPFRRRRRGDRSPSARQETSSEPRPIPIGHPPDAVGTPTDLLRAPFRRRRNPHLGRSVTLPTRSRG
jgi:hypothetical protein